MKAHYQSEFNLSNLFAVFTCNPGVCRVNIPKVSGKGELFFENLAMRIGQKRITITRMLTSVIMLLLFHILGI